MNKIRKNKIKMLFISIIFGFVNLFALNTPVQNTYAEPVPNTDVTQQLVNNLDGVSSSSTSTSSTDPSNDGIVEAKDLCRDGLDHISWLLCPKTEKGADAVDWLYEKVEDTLELNPIAGESGDIVMKIWEICRGITNIVFVILMLMVVFSQVTGFGISNYGIKRALPKLIIAAIAVNLSFYICSYAVDLSNTLGISIRNLFSGIESGIVGTSEVYNLSDLTNKFADYYDNLANFTGITAAGVPILLESGIIFMLIPAILVALVAVLSGFITIALRQVVVVLCVMIAPLAIVAIVFPNTFNLFRKWRHTLMSMLVFFPMFSLLFGASNLAGFAIIRAAGADGFMQLVGMIIQLAPLILCWKMMKMSGTVLGGVHGTISGFLNGVIVNPARRYASSLAAHSRARTLAQINPYTPSARLMQYMENRRISREMDIAEYSAHAKQRAAAFNSNKKYKLDRKGRIVGITKDGEEAYSMQIKDLEYQGDVMRDKTAMNQGLSVIAENNKDIFKYSDKDQDLRFLSLDSKMIKASDRLFAEQVHANDVTYRNDLGRAQRYERAINSYMDSKHGDEIGHRYHSENAPSRYEEIRNIMGDDESAQYAAATAFSIASSQRQLRQGQFQKYFDNTIATQDVVNRLKELTSSANATENIDSIIAGMRTLNQRGDGKLLREAINDLCANEKLEVGTAASQALANFVLFEVKDNDPALRRFGKYINLETARYYNTSSIAEGKERKRRNIDYEEYVKGGYDITDENGDRMYNADGSVMRDVPKRAMTELLMGTSFKGVEREAYLNVLESIHEAAHGNTVFEQQKQKEVLDAIMPNIVSDQFNYASGSEQINALTKYITGMKVVGYKDGDISKPQYDWDEDTLKMFSPNTAEAKKIALERTKSFLNAQVPNQIARTKSDLLGAVQKLFVQESEAEFMKDESQRSDAYKKWRQEEAEMQASGCDLSETFKTKEAERFAHYQFRNSLKDTTRGNLAKSLAKGFQGDTKENLINFMGYNDFKNGAVMNSEILNYTPKQTKPKNTPDEEDNDFDDEGDYDPNYQWIVDRPTDVWDQYNNFNGDLMMLANWSSIHPGFSDVDTEYFRSMSERAASMNPAEIEAEIKAHFK